MDRRGFFPDPVSPRKAKGFNPLVHNVHYIGRLTKILILEGIIKKNTYERRDYESVDGKILS